MANQLLETYKPRIQLAENLYARKNPGQKLSVETKMVMAQNLANVRKFLNESVRGTAGIGVQLADMGAIKQMAMDVTNLVMPNMIAQELVLVKPMTNFNTVLYWREYALGTRKGGAGGIGEVAPFAGAMSAYDPYRQELQPWNANNIINGWGTADFMKMSEERQNYTGERVVENFTAETAGAVFVASFGPVKRGAFVDPADGSRHDVQVMHTDPATGAVTGIEYVDIQDNYPVTPSMTAYERAKFDGAKGPGFDDPVKKFEYDSEGKLISKIIDGELVAKLAGRSTGYTTQAGDRIAYIYDNAYIPAEQIPSVVMRMKKRPVSAKIRRINYMFSKLAAWEAKNEYGFDLQAEMAQQCAAEIEYETDCEIIDMLTKMGDENVAPHWIHENSYFFKGYGRIVWIDEELDTIGYSVKAEGFLRKIAEAKAKIYEQTARFMPTWALVSPQMLPILGFCPGFKAASMTNVNGAFQAGTLDGMKIFCTPRLQGKVMYLGVLGKEMDAAAGVYMPFLPITPSQLLEFPDDSTVQGFVTVYGLEKLNEQLVCKIEVVDGIGSARYSLFEGQVGRDGVVPRP